MSRASIFLDESGDLGWSLDAPYRRGGSSRYLTIASLIVNPDRKHLPQRLIKSMYKKFAWPVASEKKWSSMNPAEKVFFATKAKALIEQYGDDVRFQSITVKKKNVQPHIRVDGNKLYNFMIKCSLLKEMSKHEEVYFFPDPRSIKVESGNSLHDYLQTELWFTSEVKTILRTQPLESSANKNIQFADMLSGLVQSHFEDGNSEPWRILNTNISYKVLFF